MEKYKITVIVPVYNVEKYLDRCVQSVLKQSYTNWECILVDDGSPDRCPQLCDEYEKKDERIRVVHQVNGGLAVARNTGIRIATGDIITFLDSDDWIEADFFKDIVNYWDDDLDVCLFDFIEVFGDEKKPVHQYKQQIIDFRDDPYYDKNIIRRASLADYSEIKGTTMSSTTACGNAYRTDFLKKNNLYFTPGIFAGEDIVFSGSCAFMTNKYKYVAIPEYNYFMNYESISSAGYVKMGYKLVESMDKGWERLSDLPCNAEDKTSLLKLYATISLKMLLWWAVDEEDKTEAKKGYRFCREKAKYIWSADPLDLGIVNMGLTLLCICRLFWIVKIGVKIHKQYKKILKVR